MKILVAGFGNPLREDDGFGVEVVRRLGRHAELPSQLRLQEVGIGGVSVVQELLAGFDALIVTDARENPGQDPGTVCVLELEVADLGDKTPRELRDSLADVHFAEPGRALALARGVGCLPPKVFLVGCVPLRCDLGQGLSPPVEAAVGRAVNEVLHLTRRLLAPAALEDADDVLQEPLEGSEA